MLLVGILWIVVMTWICYIGVEISANLQKVLLTIEVMMLVSTRSPRWSSRTAATRHRRLTHISRSWFNPAHVSFSSFIQGILLMLFIYWGWDSAVSVNEETKDRTKTPGRAAVISTILLRRDLCRWSRSRPWPFAGVGDKGIGLTNPDNSSDVINVARRGRVRRRTASACSSPSC